MTAQNAQFDESRTGMVDGTVEDHAPKPANPLGRTRLGCELLLVFVIGAALMQYAYLGSRTKPSAEIGVPGHDSFYHIRMAAMIREHGLLRDFPWLRFSYFTDEGQAFVSHHFGFHCLLAPFVECAQWLTGDGLAGGRWAVMACFGVVLALFHLLLIQERVPFRWLWLLLFLLLPYQFFSRHTFVRAISPSLAFMLALLIILFRGRHWVVGLVVAAYIQLYLGGAMFAPLIVGLFAAAHVIGPAAERSLPLRPVLWGTLGWLVGMLIYPYSNGALEFLRLQVLGSGLSPDISVGQEWNPYENVWWFTQMSATLLAMTVISTALRLRFGPPLNIKEFSVLLISLALLVLTLKARRFVEYWPPFALLSAAMLSTPLLQRIQTMLGGSRSMRWMRAAAASIGAGAAVVMIYFAFHAWKLVQRDARCQYDLPAIRNMMTYMKEHSLPGDVIFTDDWDIFPVFFYHNTHNHYIVGLDPKFTHERRPDLWQRYVKVSRGQVPADVSVKRLNSSGEPVQESIHVRLEDIRDHFGARFVITDRDHEPLAAKLASARHLAELVYPAGSFNETQDAPYRVFRIRDRQQTQETPQATIEAARRSGALHLSTLSPISVEQSWGDLATDRSVGGGPIYVGDTVYTRGLGTHAPSRLEYLIPEGFATFEALVGLNHSTRGKGSIVASVLLDGKEVFRSSLLTGSSPAASITLTLGNARKLTLVTEATKDGNTFDHVDWADAQLVGQPQGK